MNFKRTIWRVLIAATVVFGTTTAATTDSLSKNSNNNKAYRAPDQIDTAETEDLLNRLAHQPELICIQYLHYFIGRPQDNPSNRFNPKKNYVWYRPNRNGVKYDLIQEELQPGRITESILVFHTDDLNLDLTKVESKFGKAPKKYFDQTVSPTIEYSFAPNTLMTFTQKHNTFQVDRVQIHYKGDPLPPPGVEDIARAQLQRKGLALSHLQNGRYRESISTLSEHLGENPDDMEAHLALAQSFKANCQINEAIAQYRYTLANSANNPAVQAQCVKDLQAMKVLPSVPADTEIQNHNISLKHKGQQLRRGGLASSKKMQGNNSNDLGVQPLDPKAANTPIIGEPPVAPSLTGPSGAGAPANMGGAGAAVPGMAPMPQGGPGAGPEPF